MTSLSDLLAPTQQTPQSGYDLPLYGLEDGQFWSIHIPGLIWAYISILCAIAVIIVSFYHKGVRSFFSWNKGGRLVVYLELCDAMFSTCTVLSRMQIVITEDHVKPAWLCTMYGFGVGVSMISQALMVNVIALNAFFLMYREIDFNFGRFDYRILVYSYGVALFLCIYSAATGQFGPNGTMCTVDSVRSKAAGIITSSIMISVFITNTFLYIITWLKINKEAQQISKSLHNTSTAQKAVSNAAKTMSLFVLAFFIQWLPVTTFCIWKVFENQPPMLLMKIMVTVSNFGGFLNGCVYIIIRWKRIKPSKKKENEENNQDTQM